MYNLEELRKLVREAAEDNEQYEAKQYSNRVELHINKTTLEFTVDGDDVIMKVLQNTRLQDTITFEDEGFLEDYIFHESKRYL